MNVVREITRMNDYELEKHMTGASWHDTYKNSAWIYAGGLNKGLSEGDVLCVFSQWGEIEDINLVRDKETGVSMGFAFIKYEDQRSTILAIDNMNGVELLGFTLRVDHKDRYLPPKKSQKELDEMDALGLEEDREYRPGRAYEGKELVGEHTLFSGPALFGTKSKAEEEKQRKRLEGEEEEERVMRAKEATEKKMFESLNVSQRELNSRKLAENKKTAEEVNGLIFGWRGRKDPQTQKAKEWEVQDFEVCYFCGSKEHISKNCPTGGQQSQIAGLNRRRFYRNFPNHSDEPDVRYTNWKSNAPIMYDMLLNHNLTWPCTSCLWSGAHPAHYESMSSKGNYIFLANSTDGVYDKDKRIWQGCPSSVQLGIVELTQPNTIYPGNLAKFTENRQNSKCNFYKKMFHPGAVTKIAQLPKFPRFLISLSDASEIYIWNTMNQPNRLMKQVQLAPNKPEFTLTNSNGITDLCLDVHNEIKVVASSPDFKVLLWDMSVHQGTIEKSLHPPGGTLVRPLGVYEGAKSLVECVKFLPRQPSVLLSAVCDDGSFLFWDGRTSKEPVQHVTSIHDGEIYTMCWNPNQEFQMATGGEDRSIHVWDTRMFKSGGPRPLGVIEGHSSSVTRLEWSPNQRNFLCSGSEDATVDSDEPLFFRHGGHRGVITDLQWHPHIPWTIMSVADDGELGGGTLQIWRLNDLIMGSYNVRCSKM